MSVDITFYVVYGVKIPYDKEFSGRYDIVENIPDTIDPIFDAMSGEYIVLGKILHCNYAYEDFDFTEIDLGMLPKYEIEFRESFKKYFSTDYHLIDKPFKLIAFSHYS